MTENDREIVETLLDIDPAGAFIQGMLDVDANDDFLNAALSAAANAYDDFISALWAAEARAKDMYEQDREALGADDD